MPQLRGVLARAVTAAERAVDRRIGGYLRDRPGWGTTVVPYVGHGTPTRVHVRARVVARRRNQLPHTGRPAVLLTGIGHYLSAEVAGEPVEIALAGSHLKAVSDAEGYVDATFHSDLRPGWHPVTFSLGVGDLVPGRVLVVDPDARLGIVSDIDDTIIHTGLTRLVEAIRTTLLVAEERRLPIPGAADLYAGLVATDDGRAPVFYVSTGAWNLLKLSSASSPGTDSPPGRW